jgi:hypothetical protein
MEAQEKEVVQINFLGVNGAAANLDLTAFFYSSKKNSKLAVFCLFLILFGFSLSFIVFAGLQDLCYQETANLSNDCGGLATGKYGYNASFYLYVNYSKPLASLNSSIYQYKVGTLGLLNTTIHHSCWDFDSSVLVFRFFSDTRADPDLIVQCRNSSGYHTINSIACGCGGGSTDAQNPPTNWYDGNWDTHNYYNSDAGDWFITSTGLEKHARVYEEAIWWNMSYYCGDGYCNEDTENFLSCPADCEETPTPPPPVPPPPVESFPSIINYEFLLNHTFGDLALMWNPVLYPELKSCWASLLDADPIIPHCWLCIKTTIKYITRQSGSFIPYSDNDGGVS